MRTLTILSVDDDVELQNLLKQYLEAKGLKVITSQNGFDMLRRVVLDQPDAVIMDLEMPQMDGLQTLETLKAARITEHTPVLMASAHADPESILKAVKLGAEDFIVKPFSFEQLYQRLNQLLFRIDLPKLKAIASLLQTPEFQSTAAIWEGLDLFQYKHLRAYPALYEGHHLCLLLQPTTKLSQVEQMTLEEAEMQVLMLVKVRNSWKPVWPNPKE